MKIVFCAELYLLIYLKLASLLFLKNDFRERGKKRGEREMLFRLFMHILVDPCIALTGDRTCNLGVMGRRTNQLSCPARAKLASLESYSHSPPLQKNILLL